MRADRNRVVGYRNAAEKKTSRPLKKEMKRVAELPGRHLPTKIRRHIDKAD